MDGMTDQTLKACIKACWKARDTAQNTLFNHCLIEGGEHVEGEHLSVMADCIQVCQTAADFMTRGSEFHAQVCAACAVVCDACATSCDDFADDEYMQACAAACRACAQECHRMSQAWLDRTSAEAADGQRA